MIPEAYLSPLQDTLYTPPRTDTAGPVNSPRQDTSAGTGDSAENTVPVSVVPLKPVPATTKIVPGKSEITDEPPPLAKETIIQEEWNSAGNFLMQNGLTDFVSGLQKQMESSLHQHTSTVRPAEIQVQERLLKPYDWLLGIFMFLVILFVWIRVFYSKFFATLGSALVSFQLSAKLFQEKNVLLQRVSFVLDFVYVVVTSIFIFEFIEHFGFSEAGMSGFNLFLLLLNILMLYAILRVSILRMTGSLFMVRGLFAEYIHNTFVINKGLGIALFPIVIMARYLPYNLVPVVLTLGIIVFAIAFLLKGFRAYQIIIRRDILLFYLILYLCTLEILPLLLGYKFVTSLIQSN